MAEATVEIRAFAYCQRFLSLAVFYLFNKHNYRMQAGGDMGTKVPNWNEIRTEYINGDTSYRKIAAKYGVSYHMLKNRATKEHWYADKVAQHEEIRAKTAQKTAEMLAERNAKCAERNTLSFCNQRFV